MGKYLIVFAVFLAACGGSASKPTDAPADEDDSAPADGGDSDGNLPPTDDGDVPPTDDDGDNDPPTDKPLDNPPLVTIDYAATGCTPVIACGGAVVGGWYFSATCTEAVDFGPVLEIVDTVCGEGNSEISSFAGTIQGTAVFSATQLTRTYTRAQTTAMTLAGDTCGTAAGCIALQAALTTANVPGTCTPQISAKTCTCSITESFDNATTDDYTINGNQLVLANPTRTYDFCSTDGHVTYQLSGDATTDVTVLIAP